MAKCLYDGKRIIPVRLVTIEKVYQKSEDGQKVGSVFQLTIQGTLFAFKGSPDSDGNFYTGGGYYDPDGRAQPSYTETVTDYSRFAAIVRKQEAIRTLFANEGRQLEFQSFDASAPMKCNPRISSVTFQDGQWYDTCDYTVVCDCDVLYINGTTVGEDAFSQYVESATETWNLETVEEPENEYLPRTYRLTHSVAAKGKRFYKDDGTLLSPPWKQARDWVAPRLGFDSAMITSSGVKDLPAYYGGYNHLRSENVDENGGGYSVTETWILASGAALEDFTVNTRTSTLDGLVSVSIEGNIRGLEVRNGNMDMTSSKWTNALNRYLLASGAALARAQAYSGYNLNTIPLANVQSRNPVAGTISYSFEFDNRASNLITGAKSEVISVSDDFGVDVFAAIPVLFRAAGPVLQNIGTKREMVRTLNVEAIFGPELAGNGSAISRIRTNHPIYTAPYSTDLQTIIDAANPVLAGLSNNVGQAATIKFVANQNVNWEPNNGRLAYTVTWVWE